MENRQLISSSVRVTLGHEVFEVPASRIPELRSYLQSLHSISLTEAIRRKEQGREPQQWQGKQLITE